MDATVTIRFRAENLCNPSDFGNGAPDKTFADLVKRLIESEGLFGIVQDDYDIISIEEAA